MTVYMPHNPSPLADLEVLHSKELKAKAELWTPYMSTDRSIAIIPSKQ